MFIQYNSEPSVVKKGCLEYFTDFDKKNSKFIL